MEIRTAEDTLKEILEAYNRKPIGWQIASDIRGNGLVLGPDAGYRLKIMMINPFENVGVGVRVDNPGELRQQIGNGYSCGFRPLPVSTAKEIFASLARAISEDARQEILRSLMEMEPVPTWGIGARGMEAVVSGPFVSYPDLRAISKSQRELDEKLAQEVDRKFRAKYPMRASMFR